MEYSSDALHFSVIVCIHNPEFWHLSECLKAIDRLQAVSRQPMEVLIVDNNNTPPLAEQSHIQNFLAGPHRVLIQESRTGLTHARLAGVRTSTGSVIVFVDDDNAPEPDYLGRVTQLLESHPAVGVWGPGRVDVVWEDGVPGWIQEGYASSFQAKNKSYTEFGCVVGWPDFYPAGTGMVVKRSVFEKYAADVGRGLLGAADRRGRQMTSGGDGQIVWAAVKMGLCAGISPELRLTHLVARKKANLPYIGRMTFGVMASGPVALAEAFPELRLSIRAGLPGAIGQYALILGSVLKALLLFRIRSGPVSVAGIVGELHGRFLAVGERPPLLTRAIARLLGFPSDAR